MPAPAAWAKESPHQTPLPAPHPMFFIYIRSAPQKLEAHGAILPKLGLRKTNHRSLKCSSCPSSQIEAPRFSPSLPDRSHIFLTGMAFTPDVAIAFATRPSERHIA